jgi:hypothetical protein
MSHQKLEYEQSFPCQWLCKGHPAPQCTSLSTNILISSFWVANSCSIDTGGGGGDRGKGAYPRGGRHCAPPWWFKDSITSIILSMHSSPEQVCTICEQRKQENINYHITTNSDRKNYNSELKLKNKEIGKIWNCNSHFRNEGLVTKIEIRGFLTKQECTNTHK